MKTRLVLGGPGAGKTEWLLRRVETAFADGLKPEEIAFVTFSKGAAQEGIDRASTRFGIDPKALRYFRTLHSLCFKEMGLHRGDVIQGPQLKEIAQLTGENLTTVGAETTAPALATKGDEMLFIEQYARTTKVSLEDAWRSHGAEVTWWRLKRLSDAYRAFKRDLSMIDFTDMLEQYASAGAPVNIRLAILDEAQDLTRLQWEVVERAFGKAEELIVAGDDDQAVHKWAGAATDHLLGLPYAREVLPRSYRLPRAVFSLAANIANRIGRRYAKDWAPADREGEVNDIARPEEVDLSSGTWLLLARTRALLEPLIAAAREQGVVYAVKGRSSALPGHIRQIQGYEALRSGKTIPGDVALDVIDGMGLRASRSYSADENLDAKALGIDAREIWHDALVAMPLDEREYYLACLRRKEKLLAPPRVRIDTMHGSKGAEAENVLLSSDMTERTFRGSELDPDSEHRVWYVGATRAKERLFITAPTRFYHYQLSA